MELSNSKPQVLYKHGALAMGSELWACSSPKSSQWAQKLDWYMNFQLTKSRLSVASHLDDSLNEWVDEHDFIMGKKQSLNDGVLLFAGAGNLPCQQLIVCDYAGDPADWARRLSEVAKSLRTKSMRVFLPDAVNSHDMSRAWATVRSPGVQLTFVPGKGEHLRNV